jgi:hypothetical protein
MNSHTVFLVLVLWTGALLSSCDQSNPTAPADTAATTPADSTGSGTAAVMTDPQATLSASPNPVPAGAGLGTVTLQWKTGRPTAAIYVSIDGGEEALFAEGSEGTSSAAWIQTGATYDFKMYSDTARKESLGHVSVRRAQ